MSSSRYSGPWTAVFARDVKKSRLPVSSEPVRGTEGDSGRFGALFVIIAANGKASYFLSYQNNGDKAPTMVGRLWCVEGSKHAYTLMQ